MGYYDFRDTKNSVLEVQRILRALDSSKNKSSRVKPDGIYGDDTRLLVSKIQEKYGLIPTGVVDYETWKLLHSIYEVNKDLIKSARAVNIFPSNNYEIFPNSKDGLLFVIQYMINEIVNDHDDIDELQINGVYDVATQNAVKLLLKKSLNDSSLNIDASVFNVICDEYERVNLRGY